MSKPARTIVSLLLVGLFFGCTHGGGEGEASFEGRWQARYTSSGSVPPYELEFSGDRFHAVDGPRWYKGEIAIDTGADPARIDFTIRECECSFVGQTSTAIFRWDGDAIEIRAPQPGNPRPTEFDETSGETMRLVRKDE